MNRAVLAGVNKWWRGGTKFLTGRTLAAKEVERFGPDQVEVGKMKLPFAPDPVIEAYKKDIDMTLVRESLKMSVQERVERLLALQLAVEELRSAGAEMRARKQAR